MCGPNTGVAFLGRVTNHPSWPGAQGFPRMWDFLCQHEKILGRPEQVDPSVGPVDASHHMGTHSSCLFTAGHHSTWRLSLGTSKEEERVGDKTHLSHSFPCSAVSPASLFTADELAPQSTGSSEARRSAGRSVVR